MLYAMLMSICFCGCLYEAVLVAGDMKSGLGGYGAAFAIGLVVGMGSTLAMSLRRAPSPILLMELFRCCSGAV